MATDFFQVSIVPMSGLQAELNRIDRMDGGVVVDIIATGGEVGLIYIDGKNANRFDAANAILPDPDDLDRV